MAQVVNSQKGSGWPRRNSQSDQHMGQQHHQTVAQQKATLNQSITINRTINL